MHHGDGTTRGGGEEELSVTHDCRQRDRHHLQRRCAASHLDFIPQACCSLRTQPRKCFDSRFLWLIPAHLATQLPSLQDPIKSPKMEVSTPVDNPIKQAGRSPRSAPVDEPPALAPPTPMYSRGSSKFPANGMDAVHSNPRMSSMKQIASLEKKVRCK